MSYRPSSLSPIRAVVLLIWSFCILFAVSAVLFVFTYGDCFDDGCRTVANRNFFLITGLGFVVYWTGIFLLVRRWSR